MTDPRPSARENSLLAGLLLLTTMLAAVMLWVPMVLCPRCRGEGRVPGLTGLSLQETEGLRKLSRRPNLNRCGECETRGRVSVLQKWTIRP